MIHNITRMLHTYGVPEDQVLGIPFGFKGLNNRTMSPIPLSPAYMDSIRAQGGSVMVGLLVIFLYIVKSKNTARMTLFAHHRGLSGLSSLRFFHLAIAADCQFDTLILHAAIYTSHNGSQCVT